ncbi:MAG: 30S ribosome-binding factor RbfA [Candidatus Aminicenantes bacterium]|nr:30S ribosome-binding factor RbfA [Candidatus Aminicenantes bacterium]
MPTRRQKRVASLIKEELSRLLVEEIQDSSSGLITITGVEMSPDLKTAHIYLSIFGAEQKEIILELLDKKKGYLRKSIASRVKLKYNPLLIFSFDQSPEYEAKIDKLLENIKKNEK